MAECLFSMWTNRGAEKGVLTCFNTIDIRLIKLAFRYT
jgi:hypothetical protein